MPCTGEWGSQPHLGAQAEGRPPVPWLVQSNPGSSQSTRGQTAQLPSLPVSGQCGSDLGFMVTCSEFSSRSLALGCGAA